jgi:protein CpxP
VKKRNVLILALLLAVVTVGFVACKHGPHRRGFDKFDVEAAVNRAASRLDLDEAQTADLAAIAADIAAKAKQMRADREANHRELADLIRQETLSRDAVDRMAAEKLAKVEEMVDFVADRLIAFHATLSVEQREKIAEQIEAHAERGCRFARR